MRCTHCGANIPDDQLICPVCGAEVQIVPDYNPLEDVLAREVKGSVAGATRQIQADVVAGHLLRADDCSRSKNTRLPEINAKTYLRFFSCSFFWLVSEFISDIRIPIQA